MTPKQQESQFRTWIADHESLLMHCVRGFAPPVDQDDLLQEILIAVWHAVPRFRGDAEPSTFIYRVAQNTALTWRRRLRRRPVAEAYDDERRPAPAPADTERSEALYRAIRELPALDRSLVLLYLDQVPYRKMATILGLSESNVGVRLTRIRTRLATLMQEETP